MTTGTTSEELRTGIERYRNRIAAIGGYGVRVRAEIGGVTREGALIELGYGGCQPGIQTDDGSRWAVALDHVSRI